MEHLDLENVNKGSLSQSTILHLEDLVNKYVKQTYDDSVELKDLKLDDLNILCSLDIPRTLNGSHSVSNIKIGSDTLENITDEEKVINIPVRTSRNKKFTVTPIQTLHLKDGETVINQSLTSIPSIHATFMASAKQNFQNSHSYSVIDNQYYENEIPVCVAPHSKADISTFVKRLQFDAIIRTSVTLDGLISFSYIIHNDGYEGEDIISIQELIETLHPAHFKVISTSSEHNKVIYQGHSRLQGTVDLNIFMENKGTALTNTGNNYEFTKILTEDVEESLSPLPSDGEYYVDFDTSPKLTSKEQDIVAYTRDVIFLNNRNSISVFPKFKYGVKSTAIHSIESAEKIEKIVASGKNHFENFGNTEITRKSIAEEVTLTETVTSTKTNENLVEGTVSLEFSGKAKIPLIAKASTKLAFSLKYNHKWINTDTNTHTTTEKVTVPSQDVKIPPHTSSHLEYVLHQYNAHGFFSPIWEIENNIRISVPMVYLGYYHKDLSKEITTGSIFMDDKHLLGVPFERKGSGPIVFPISYEILESEEILNATPYQFFKELAKRIIRYPLTQNNPLYRRLGVFIGLKSKDFSLFGQPQYHTTQNILFDAAEVIRLLKFKDEEQKIYVSDEKIPFSATVGKEFTVRDTQTPL
ncbi:ETX/MTX2 family pore-forming toxin [Bacillus cereus group sp. Bc256]|uniref:ETX/MTX2 family pore-forming toxin n=1 Tax=unclassified Bacillus cereus group TaxID=2750818 RepID=UPI0022E667C6|nr:MULTISPECIES: ETX/MTX2 family pore-forming toxin [unclassified Bacillus cereus group]MDA2139103.1 ETX/MTX2 family pore-forming toxin [Bacillus cereus group sp. Bc256]MDA2598491.1 ETX/MTX2 family pore-forming toxin [Bacillus cereus group sp. Bc061]